MERSYAEYILKKTKNDYNLIADDFSRYRKNPWSEAQFLINDYLIPGERILDLGCGVGQWLEFLKNKKVNYIGVDNSEKLIKIAKEKYPKARFQVADVLNLPFPKNYFDKVYAIALLHHIPSEEFRLRVLKEAKRVLKPEGLLILTVWNLWQKIKTKKIIFKSSLLKVFWKSKLDFKDILMDWMRMPDCYFHCFTKKELVKVVKEAKLKLIKEGEFLVGIERKISPKLPNSNFYIVAEK